MDKESVRWLAKRFGWDEVQDNEASRVLGFVRHGERVNVYYTTGAASPKAGGHLPMDGAGHVQLMAWVTEPLWCGPGRQVGTSPTCPCSTRSVVGLRRSRIATLSGLAAIARSPRPGTVGTCVDHPRQGKTQLFRRHQTLHSLEDIFYNPRVHTGTPPAGSACSHAWYGAGRAPSSIQWGNRRALPDPPSPRAPHPPRQQGRGTTGARRAAGPSPASSTAAACTPRWRPRS